MLLSPAVEAAATAAIAERGHFALAIPGGSVLKMLAGSTPSWAAQTTLAYVNHKCVAMDDAALATHAKARAGFLDAGWAGVCGPPGSYTCRVAGAACTSDDLCGPKDGDHWAVDELEVWWTGRSQHFPDSALVVGIILFMLHYIFLEEEENDAQQLTGGDAPPPSA